MDKYDILKQYYGYNTLKEHQVNIIDSINENKDIIGILPTGYGKSVCFQIPAIMKEGVCLVISPLIALMQDQVNSLNKKGIPSAFISSIQDYETQKSIYFKLSKGKIKILYVAAERLESNMFLSTIKKIKISFICADEAHTILWGEDFRSALAKIPVFINSLGYKVPMLALTATATNNTVEKIKELLSIKNPIVIHGSVDRKNIFYRVINTRNKDARLLDYIKDKKGIKGIIYTLTIRKAVYVYEMLKREGYSVGIYHGKLEKNEKNLMYDNYINNSIDIMVCTNAFGMGIDIPTIRYVILYDMPASLEDFSQQSGRASRDGAYAEAIVLFNIDDLETVKYFIDNIEDFNNDPKRLKKIKEDRYKKMEAMANFCLSKKCLHQVISNYFNEYHPGKCMMCANCKK